ncbi:Mycobacterium rhizamassiliense ORFan [Mycobacterium rhizamassiliense]|uniref:Mycobacterium rhizamassiliense ORFan n=1 Tax=Mycobacterium rhizamassiliense TaxID=1841860 RepID=A0A2U3NPK6_9MYCO|nr:hypothetical protein [Mycobacterium rhizamassiliense]SPM33446.1 Mycobacterium rhizamassiliense ORFan [Mycobacterium rhizamassiliense]
MSISLPSVRTAVVGAVGAGVLGGTMLFAATAVANAETTSPAPTPAVAPADSAHVNLASIWHHDPHHRHDLHHSVNIL